MFMQVGFVYKYIEDDIPKYFVYIGDSDDASVVIGGYIGSTDSTRKYFPIEGLKLVAFSDKPVFVKTKFITGVFQIKGKPFELNKNLFNKIIINLVSSIINEYKNDVVKTIDDNYDSSGELLKNLVVPEKVLRLLQWNQKKKELKFNTARPQMASCIKYGVYFAYLGTNIGSEIDKLRPVVIWKKHECSTNPLENSYFVFPISSKIPKRDFDYNVKIIINGKQNVIHLNDGKRISGLRILKPLKDDTTKIMHKLNQSDISLVKEAIRKYFNII